MAPIRISLNSIMQRRQKVLLVRRDGTKFYRGFFALPAGHLEIREDVRSGLVREIQEEIGYKRGEYTDPKLVCVMNRVYSDYTYLDLFYESRLDSDFEPTLEVGKIDTHLWCGPADMPDNTVPYVRKFLEKYWNRKPEDRAVLEAILKYETAEGDAVDELWRFA